MTELNKEANEAIIEEARKQVKKLTDEVVELAELIIDEAFVYEYSDCGCDRVACRHCGNSVCDHLDSSDIKHDDGCLFLKMIEFVKVNKGRSNMREHKPYTFHNSGTGNMAFGVSVCKRRWAWRHVQARSAASWRHLPGRE